MGRNHVGLTGARQSDIKLDGDQSSRYRIEVSPARA
jgi:hypothetical protein